MGKNNQFSSFSNWISLQFKCLTDLYNNLFGGIGLLDATQYKENRIMKKKLVAGLTMGFLVFGVVGAVNAAIVFFDDFEDRNLVGWSQSNSGGSGTFDVVGRNHSNRAHVGHVSNTSSGDGSSLSMTFDYTASNIISFEMEALAFLGQYTYRTRHGLAGVEVSFLNVFNVPLGSAGLYNVTSTSLLGPNDSYIGSTQQNYSVRMQQFAELAGLNDSDPIAKMSLSFVAEGSYSWGGNIYPNVRSGGNVWFDNVLVTSVPVPAAGWLLGSGLLCIGTVRMRRSKK